MIQFLLSTYLLLLSTSFLLAQETNQLNMGAGYSYSSTKIGIENSLLIGLNPVEPKAGFYISLAYEHQLSSLLTSQVELIFQQKGYQTRNFFEQTTIPVRYNYLGISPTIGIRPIKKLSFLFGPELNLLITKSTTLSDGKPIELGLVCRVVTNLAEWV